MTSPSVLDAVDDLLSWATAVLCDLIAEPSITGDERRAQERFAAVLRDLSLDVDMWCPLAADVVGHPSFCDDGLPLGERPVVVGRWGEDENGPTLVLNGHMDVVPAGDAAKWSHDPWKGTVADGGIYGRGACDMKGGLVAAVLAIAALQQAGVEPATNVLVHSVIGEETGGAGTLAAILRGYAGAGAIILEPTGMDVCPVGAGAASFRLVVHGRAAHAALRQDGVSSVELFGELMGAMAAFESERHAGFSHAAFPDDFLVAPVSVGRVAAGDWPSTVPERLVAEGRCGVLPGERLADARRRFEQWIAGAARGGRWSGVAPPTVEWFEGQFEPGETPPEAPLLHALARAHAEVVGTRPRVRGVPYGSDLRLFTNDAGVPAVLYGPGDATVAHAVDEHVPIEQLRHVAKVIALILTQESQAALFGRPTDATRSG